MTRHKMRLRLKWIRHRSKFKTLRFHRSRHPAHNHQQCGCCAAGRVHYSYEHIWNDVAHHPVFGTAKVWRTRRVYQCDVCGFTFVTPSYNFWKVSRRLVKYRQHIHGVRHPIIRLRERMDTIRWTKLPIKRTV